MKTIKLSIAAVTALILGITSCKKEETSSGNGTISIELSHKFGMMNEQTLAIGSPVVHPMKGDTLTFSKFKYFISNVKFKKADGTYWTESESYHIVDLATPGSLKLNFSD